MQRNQLTKACKCIPANEECQTAVGESNVLKNTCASEGDIYNFLKFYKVSLIYWSSKYNPHTNYLQNGKQQAVLQRQWPLQQLSIQLQPNQVTPRFTYL